MDIKVNGDFITLGQFLKLTNFVSTGGEAKFAVKKYHIIVNGEIENRRGRKLRVNDEVVIDGKSFHLI